MAVFAGTTKFKHGVSAYNVHKCRCVVCKEATRAKRKAEKARLWGTEPPNHGTNRAYGVHGCRCKECVSAKSEWQKNHRLERLGKEPPKHGSTGHWLYGCRCEVCVKAKKASDEKRQSNPLVIISERERGWTRQGIKNFTYVDFQKMYEKQDGECAICCRHMEKMTTRGSSIKRTKVANVDHNHETGEVRALLCNNCNKMLGCGEIPDTLRKGAAYLEYHNGEEF